MTTQEITVEVPVIDLSVLQRDPDEEKKEADLEKPNELSNKLHLASLNNYQMAEKILKVIEIILKYSSNLTYYAREDHSLMDEWRVQV